MKRIRTLLAAVALFVVTIGASAQPMSYDAMRMNARFLTDRMAYTLGLGAEILDDHLWCERLSRRCGPGLPKR